MLTILGAAALANPAVELPDAETIAADTQDLVTMGLDRVEDLQAVLEALERLHPNVVAEVKREEETNRCTAAMADPLSQDPEDFVACVRISLREGVACNVDALVAAAWVAYPEDMPRYSEDVWRPLFDAGMRAHHRAEEQRVAISERVEAEAAAAAID